MEKYIVLKDVHFGFIDQSLHAGDLIEHDTKTRQIMINGEGPFTDKDLQSAQNLERKFGIKYVAVDNSENRKKAKAEEIRVEKAREKFADKSVYEAEKFEVEQEQTETIQEINVDLEENMGKKYPRDHKTANDPGKPKASKIGNSVFNEQTAYKEGIETDFPVVVDNSSTVLENDFEGESLNAGKKPSMSAEEKAASTQRRAAKEGEAQRRKPGRPKKEASAK